VRVAAVLVLATGCAELFGLETVTYDPSTCAVDADCADVGATARCDCGNCAVQDTSCEATSRRWLPDAPSPLGGACVPAPAQLDARVFHACASMSDGSVRCWGGNNEGQLGIAQPVGTGATVPVEVELSSGRLSDVVEVRTGAASTCARRVDGTVTCWGANSFGQLGGALPIGPGVVGDPVVVTDGTAPIVATALSLGFFSACALGTSGDVFCWGLNGRGQLGDGTQENRNVAVRVAGLPGPATRIATGGEHTCALVGGHAYCWGRTGSGRIGDNTPTTTDTVALTPQGVRWNATDLLPDVIAISAGNRHTCAVKNPPMEIYCWGRNETGAIGDGTTSDAAIAIRVDPPAGAIDRLSAGHDHTCATVNDDTSCWGGDLRGQLGDGDDDNANEPRPVSALSDMRLRDLVAGFEFSCALGADYTARCWGANANGELGLGDASGRDTPSELPAAAWCPAPD